MFFQKLKGRLVLPIFFPSFLYCTEQGQCHRPFQEDLHRSLLPRNFLIARHILGNALVLANPTTILWSHSPFLDSLSCHQDWQGQAWQPTPQQSQALTQQCPTQGAAAQSSDWSGRDLHDSIRPTQGLRPRRVSKQRCEKQVTLRCARPGGITPAHGFVVAQRSQQATAVPLKSVCECTRPAWQMKGILRRASSKELSDCGNGIAQRNQR